MDAIKAKSPNTDIQLLDAHGAAFNNDIILQTYTDGTMHVVHINPIDHSSRVITTEKNSELVEQVELLPSVKNIRLSPNPYDQAKSAVPAIMSAAGLGNPSLARPQGWCKLNFLAEVNGEHARITYVLRDGHIDVTRYTGEDGMNQRSAFLRLHIFHGRSPGWSARNTWSIFIDIMAIAMVSWAVTATVLMFGLENFHAMTKM